MIEVDGGRAECHVIVRREGLAKAVGHDVKVGVREHTIEVADDLSVKASFQTGSLYVIGALDGDDVQQGKLSASDAAKIEKHIRNDVLDASRYPRVAFESTSVEPSGDDYQVRGKLTLHGRTRELAFRVRREDRRLVARVTLHQPDFGIKPFKAFLGALKVKPDVEVVVTMPED